MWDYIKFHVLWARKKTINTILKIKKNDKKVWENMQLMSSSFQKSVSNWPRIVAHACNPSTLGG